MIENKEELYDKCENMEQLYDKYYQPLLKNWKELKKIIEEKLKNWDIVNNYYSNTLGNPYEDILDEMKKLESDNNEH